MDFFDFSKENLNIINYHSILLNIKSKYLIIKILDNLKRNKSLTIIKHNKKIQNKLDINKNTYKEYIYIYSQIILEIIPSKNEYGKFINIQKK